MKTVLVVDDFESVRFYHQLILTRGGFQTLSARNGAEALAVFERAPVDLIMLDLMMPDGNGDEFLRRMRSDPRHQRLPVLVISTEAQLEAARRLAREPACEVLQKPILPDALLAAVRRLIAPAGC